MRLIARREHSTSEVSAALIAKGYDPAVVATTIEELLDERMLNDARVAGAVLRAKTRRGQGPARVRQAFEAAGLGEEDINQALTESPDWLALAREVRVRKFGPEVPKDWPTRAKQMRFLQYRGFSKEQIAAAFE